MNYVDYKDRQVELIEKAPKTVIEQVTELAKIIIP